jgi:ABC-type maltose transport system permease subunit
MSENNTSLAVRKSAERTKRRMKTMLSFMFKVCLGIVMIFPIIIMISWSIRSDVELVKYGASLIPHDPTFRFYTWCF